MVIFTYFHENLTDRYRTTGAPNIGTFENDLKEFLKTSVTISQRAKLLQKLDERWSTVYSTEEQTGEGAEAGAPAADAAAGDGAPATDR